MRLGLARDPNSVLKILCLGAHSDDIEIGCGGTLMRLISENQKLEVNWIVFGSSGLRTKEAQDSATALLDAVIDRKIVVKGYRDGFFPFMGSDIKEYFEQLKSEVEPDIIFTHYRQDLHQDHRLLSELTWNTFRKHLILEYEIPKYDGDLGSPNFYVRLPETLCQAKIQHLLTHFRTQAERHWFTEDTFWSLMRLRGVESSSPEKYAEAFYCRKMTY